MGIQACYLPIGFQREQSESHTFKTSNVCNWHDPEIQHRNYAALNQTLATFGVGRMLRTSQTESPAILRQQRPRYQTITIVGDVTDSDQQRLVLHKLITVANTAWPERQS
jgi:hypothetical protein